MAGHGPINATVRPLNGSCPYALLVPTPSRRRLLTTIQGVQMRVRPGRESWLSRSLFILVAIVTLGAPGMGILTPSPRVARAADSADIDQCANGGVGNPDLQCTGSNWQNGNLNGNQAHYNEGDSVPYRMKFGGLV